MRVLQVDHCLCPLLSSPSFPPLPFYSPLFPFCFSLAGLGEACSIAGEEMDNDRAWVDALSQRLRKGITSRIPEVVLNGDEEARYAGNVNFSFAYVEGESLLMALKNIAVSSGSACTSASLEPSYGASSSPLLSSPLLCSALCSV